MLGCFLCLSDRHNCFWAAIFFPFLPDLAHRKHKTLLEGCCQLAEVLAILFPCVDAMELPSSITLVILILPNKRAALVLVLASGSNRLEPFQPNWNCHNPITPRKISPIILGSCEVFGYCPVKLRDVGSICACRKCRYGPDLGKDRVHVLDSLWNDYLLGFRVLQPDFLVTLGWKIPTCVALI